VLIVLLTVRVVDDSILALAWHLECEFLDFVGLRLLEVG
jgi:hypothetical protein